VAQLSKWFRAACVAMFLIVAVGLLVGTNYAGAKPGPQIVIGLMAELSGPFAPNGEHCKEGYEVAREAYMSDGQVGNYSVRIVYGDTRGEPRTGVSEFKRLTEIHKAIAVITTRSQVAMPLNPLSRRKQIPLLTTVGHSEFIRANPYGFRFWASATVVGGCSVQESIAMDKHRAAVLTLEDEFTLSLTDSFVREFERLGGVVVFKDTIVETEIDFSTLTTKIKSAKPDVIFVNLGLATTGLMIKKIREQGLQAQLIGNSWMTERSVIASAGQKAIEGAFFIDFDFQKPAFVAHVKRLFPRSEPVAVTYACYAALGTLLQTIKRSSKITDSGVLYQELFNTKVVNLLDGDLELKGREAQLDLVVKFIRQGKLACS